MAFRPKIKNADGSLKDLPLAAETAEIATKLKNSRSIGLSGVKATAQPFNGTSAITIPVTEVPATLLTGTASISTTGNAATATNANTAKNYSNDGNIKTKFDSLDSSVANIGKVKIGTTLYQVRTTTDINDGGQAGYITFIV